MTDHQDSDNMRDLEPPLARAVEAVLTETLPDDAVSRVRDRAKRLETTVSSGSSTANESATRMRTRSPRRLLAWSASGVTAIAAALLMALFFFSSSTSLSFAEMLAAVGSRPWVH
jgi:ferric-dicitrate binding protein FerR (iron transport regulator)